MVTVRRKTINLRACQKQKAMINQAAEVLGRSRSEFMFEAACREAETSPARLSAFWAV